MGGHTAWRKRVQRGELAKKMGGAICRHRPRLGPKVKEAIAKQRRGYTNPKKKKNKSQHDEQGKPDTEGKVAGNLLGDETTTTEDTPTTRFALSGWQLRAGTITVVGLLSVFILFFW